MKSFYSINGPLDYDKVLIIQKKLNKMVNGGELEGAVLIMEHFPVYTCGIHKDKGEIDIGYEIRKVERGGGITFHCDGQIVIYFIMNLKEMKINVKELIETIHLSIITFLIEVGIDWAWETWGKILESGLENRKICST
ncbi:lipoate-protein ligase B, partial [mine drainage metagenome]